MIEKIDLFLANKKVQKILQQPLKFRIAAMLILFLFLMFIFYGMQVSPVISQVAKVKSDNKSLEDKVVSLIKRQKDIAELKKQVKELEKHIAKEELNIPEKVSIPEFLSLLSENVKSSGINVVELTPAGVKKNNTLGLYDLDFKASLKGDYDDFIKLLVALMSMKEIVVIKNLEVVKSTSNILVINMNLRSYSRQGV